MQPVERKRQGYIHELIETEERYVDDLQLVVEVRAPGSAGSLWGGGSYQGVLFDSEVTSSNRHSHTLRMLPLPVGGALTVSSQLLLSD